MNKTDLEKKEMAEKISNLTSLVSQSEVLTRETEAKCKNYENEKEALAKELEKLKEEYQNLISSGKDMEKNSQEASEKLRNECESLKKNEENLQKNVADLKQKTEEQEQQIKEIKLLMEEREEKFEKEKSDLLIKIENLAKEKQNLENDFSNEKLNLKSINEEIQTKLNKLNSELENSKNDNSSVELINQLNQDVDTLSEKLKKQESKEIQLKDDYETIIRDLKEIIKETYEQNEKLGAEMSDLKSRFESCDIEIGNNKELIEFYESENSQLKHELQVLRENTQGKDSDKKSKYKLVSEMKPVPRLFCDICDEFDLHNTDDCPQQSQPANPNYPDPNELATHSKHNYEKESNRFYCDECEMFGHEEAQCPNQKSNVSDEEF